MVIAWALVATLLQDSPASLLDQVVALPADKIQTQITRKCEYIADEYEFVDEFKTDTLGPRKSLRNPMENLVALGAGAVPYLTSQLGSKEPSKFIIQADKDSKCVGYEFYDPKTRKPDTDYWDVVTMEQVNNAKPFIHPVTRGDLAYYALGQITNRWYGILFPGKITLYCSASDNPNIQRQAQEDWGNCTNQTLEISLRSDVRKPDTYARMVYGFQRFRSYFPGASVELAVETLRNTYGRFPKGQPEIEPRTFFIELQPIASYEIDQVIYKYLSQTDSQNGFLSDYELTRQEILLYLKDRRDYKQIAIKYAKDMVKKKEDKFGYVTQFLRRYGS